MLYLDIMHIKNLHWKHSAPKKYSCYMVENFGMPKNISKTPNGFAFWSKQELDKIRFSILNCPEVQDIYDGSNVNFVNCG